MFDFEKPEDGAQERFYDRIDTWSRMRRRLPKAQHYAWWLVHNLVAHPAIGLIPIRASFDFHDWTSRKLNGQ